MEVDCGIDLKLIAFICIYLQGITSLHLLPGLWGAVVMEAVTILGIDNQVVTLNNRCERRERITCEET